MIRKGRKLYNEKSVIIQAKTYNATYYEVNNHSVINIHENNEWRCDCHWASNRPPERWGYCKHVVACMIFKNNGMV